MPGLAPGIFLSIGATMTLSISPLAPTDVPDMPAIAGVRLATVRAEQAKRQVAMLARTIAAEGADSLAMERSRRRRHEEREASE